MLYKPHDYQLKAKKYILENKNTGLFLDMGLGKSVTTMSAFEELINSLMILKPLIIGPKYVTEQTWKAEIAKWDHLKGLKISRIIGTEKQRIIALHAKADMYAISRDNIAWLVTYLLKQRKKIWPFDALIVDESSSFKNPQSRRFKALKKVANRCDKVVLLSGTPAPNGYLDLWSQIFLLDEGERLGRTLTTYRNEYFYPNPNGFGYLIKEGSEAKINEKIADICISMKAEDYLDLPKRIDIIKTVELESMSRYKEFKKKEFLAMDNGFDDITPLSASGLYLKLIQYCNGAVYDVDKNYHLVDESKMSAVLEAYEELQGQPVLIFYTFKSDKERLLKAIPDSQTLRGEEDIDKWNRGEIKCLIVHPASMGHGLNLQYGGHYMFWYGLPDSLELYLQAVGRLDRQGQVNQVRNFMFVSSGTVEERVARRLADKDATQKSLLEALKAEFSNIS